MSLRGAVCAIVRALSPHAPAVVLCDDDGAAAERKSRAALRDSTSTVRGLADRVKDKSGEAHDVLREFVHGVNADRQRDIVRRGE